MSNVQILVVEDDLIVAHSIRGHLEDLGYGVPAVVARGEEAVRQAGEIRPDLVLMDIRLSGAMDGIEAAAQIRAHYEIPVVYLTAYADEETLARAKITEPFGYILKPFSVKELHSAIEVALYKHQSDLKIAHLNRVLRAIRNVNQIIVRENDRAKLLDAACQGLVETRGYQCAWIVCIDQSGDLVQAAQAGFEYPISHFVERLERGERSKCWEQAVAQNGVVLIEDLDVVCAGCLLEGERTLDGRRLVIRLEHSGKTFGVMGVSIAQDLTVDEEERSLFQEVAGDIAFALYNIEKEEKRQWAEQALQESEATLKSIFRAAPTGIGLVRDRVLLQVNDRICEMVGRPRKELLGKSARVLYPTDQDSERVGREKYAQIREQGTGTIETRWQHKDGKVIDVLLSSTPLDPDDLSMGVTFTALDITERRQAAQALSRRNRELALLNRAAQALSATLDLDQVLAIALEEVRHLLDVVASSVWLFPAEGDVAAGLIEPGPQGDLGVGELVCLHATGPQSELVKGWRLPSGQGIAGWVAQNGRSLYVPDALADVRHFGAVDEQTGLALRSIISVPLRAGPQVIGVLQVVDIEVERFQPGDVALVESLAATVSIAIENARLFAQEEQRVAELARALQQQQELDRLRSEFIQNISHELRTPLAIARGYAELLESGSLGELQPDQQEPVAVIARRMRMLTRMMDDIAAILDAETRAVEREPVDLAALVQAMLADFNSAAEKEDLSLTAWIASDLPPVLGNPAQLQRVLDNLVGNAFKFTPAGGHVTVRLEQEDKDLVLEVSDTGVGIPPEQLDRIFERFYQIDGSTTRRYGGTGLGLALVKELIQAHGGEVSVQSQVDKGSTFRVTLPLDRASTVQEKQGQMTD